MRDVQQWSYEYPWGRKSPQRRREELEGRRKEVERRRKKLQDRFHERMVDFDRQIEAIEAEIALTEKCDTDRLRRQIREIAHRLFEIDIDVFDEIDRRDVSLELLEELRAREEAARQQAEEREDSDKTDTSQDSGFIDDELVSEDDLNIFTRMSK